MDWNYTLQLAGVIVALIICLIYIISRFRRKNRGGCPSCGPSHDPSSRRSPDRCRKSSCTSCSSCPLGSKR